LKQVREGFIVDEEDEDEGREARRRERKKRKREKREEAEADLDAEDLDLIGEANPEFARRVQAEPKLKRLKRGHQEEREERIAKGPGDLFDSDDEDEGRGYGAEPARPTGRYGEDEFDDFIEDDYEDGEGRGGADDDAEVVRTVTQGFKALQATAGLDEAALEDFKEAFGDGGEYDWALALQEQDEDGMEYDEEGGLLSKGIELKDVFEPSQLEERMLTEKDNVIRTTDVPERYQTAREPYKDLEMTDEQLREEAIWIANGMAQRRGLPSSLAEPFQKSVAKVLEFMITDDFEVPFIFQHRKDYLIHAQKIPVTPDPNNPNAPEYVVHADKLLNQSDLWMIFDLDLKFRAFLEKRNSLERTYKKVQDLSDLKDPVFEETLSSATTMEELQDVQDYLHFEHSARIADSVLTNGHANGKNQRRPGAGKMLFDKIRRGNVYRLVRAFGITADGFAQNALKAGRREYTEDASETPEVMAGSSEVLDPPEYSSGAQCLRAARAMFAEEIAMSPKMRKYMRQAYYPNSVIECNRTEKGLRKIDEHHPYYEFKYLRNQQLRDFAQQPGLFLRMLKAEEEGLIEIKVRLQNFDALKKSLYSDLESDNFSDIADAWNRERREALDMALQKLDKIMVKNLRETLKAECDNEIARSCRDKFLARLDQAPYKPKGMILGTVPRVLALSNGAGNYGRDPVHWVWVEEDSRVLEHGKFVDISVADPEARSEKARSDGEDLSKLVELVARRKPDVIAVSGFSTETRRLYKQIQKIVEAKDLRSAEFEDDDGREISEPLDVVIVNDEIARLYQTSDRAAKENPTLPTLAKYCVALAHYLQDPLREYASLGRDLVSITFDPNQSYLSQERLMKSLETAMVDMVNLCGVNVNEAVSDPSIGNLLPFVCGLGPRKAQQLLKVINLNGGQVMSRAELVGDPDAGKLAAVGPRVWNNCASFLWVEFDQTEPESEYLDNTRVHPEDYDLGRKMAADALELDEEDIQVEQQENGQGATVRKLIKDEAQEKVNDLILEEYAEQLEVKFNQRKRATLETIRAELQIPYEELRRNFEVRLPEEEVFTMFTGETYDSLCTDMIVPMSIKRVNDDSIEGKLDCGVDAMVNSMEIMEQLTVSAKQIYQPHQTVQAKIVNVDHRELRADMTLIDFKLRRPFKRDHNRLASEWDGRQEEKDREDMQEKNDVSGRTQRVIKHPNFRPFNSAQAEEYLGSQAQGDVVIRPSSKGPDHLAVTWKVADGVYQHIDVLELDKENEYSVGKILKIGGLWTYTDLDELIVNHVKAMARKVNEMMRHEKFQDKPKSEAGKLPITLVLT
jgi:transcription elongation factor SPT6